MHSDAKLLKLVVGRRRHLLKVSFKMHEIGCLSLLDMKNEPESNINLKETSRHGMTLRDPSG